MLGGGGRHRPAGASLGLALGTLGLPLRRPAGPLDHQPLRACDVTLDGPHAGAGPAGAAFACISTTGPAPSMAISSARRSRCALARPPGPTLVPHPPDRRSSPTAPRP